MNKKAIRIYFSTGEILELHRYPKSRRRREALIRRYVKLHQRYWGALSWTVRIVPRPTYPNDGQYWWSKPWHKPVAPWKEVK